MIIEPFFITGLLTVFGCLILIVISLVVLYFRSSKALSALNTEFILYKRDQESQARAALEAATKKAQEIISSTQLFSEETKRWVMDAVSKSIAHGSSTYDQIISDLGTKSIHDLLLYSEELKKSIESQTLKLTEHYENQLKVEEESFHQTLEKNEEQILKEIKDKASKLLPEILREATKRSLTTEEAENLIIDSIEKIKKEHAI